LNGENGSAMTKNGYFGKTGGEMREIGEVEGDMIGV
jgi:hypothetical protein